MYKNILILAIALILPLNGRTNDLHLTLPEKAHELLAPKTNALGLEEINNIIVNDQIELQISYEQLLQAQKRIGQARAQYFPYGLGMIASMYFFNIWNPILLVELVTSLPSKIYHVQTEKNMSLAQYHSNKALKENIKNQVAHLYYDILREESALKLAKMEVLLLETLYSVTSERVTLGLSSEQDLRSVELRLLDLRDICLQFAGYLSAEKAAFNTMISHVTSEYKKFELQPVSDFLKPSDFQIPPEILRLNALDRSPEIVAAQYMINAAINAKNSASWSILSFNGIGFGYWSKVRVARSKIDQAMLNRDLLDTTLANQTYVANHSFHRSLDHFLGEKEVFNDTSFFYNSVFKQFSTQNATLDELIETGIIYLKDFRDLVVSHYDALKKLNDLERIALGSVRGSSTDADKFDVVFSHINSNKYYLSVNTDEDVKSVEYVFDSKGLHSMKISNKSTQFRVMLSLISAKDFSGHVNVMLNNGKTITKLFKF